MMALSLVIYAPYPYSPNTGTRLLPVVWPPPPPPHLTTPHTVLRWSLTLLPWPYVAYIYILIYRCSDCRVCIPISPSPHSYPSCSPYSSRVPYPPLSPPYYISDSRCIFAAIHIYIYIYVCVCVYVTISPLCIINHLVAHYVAVCTRHLNSVCCTIPVSYGITHTMYIVHWLHYTMCNVRIVHVKYK